MAVEGLYDIVEINMCKGSGMIEVEAEGFNIPSGRENIVYAIAQNIIKKFDLNNVNISIRVIKGVPPGSGLGSSGASSAATAYGFMKLLNEKLDENDLLKLAGEGEAVVAGTPHYDNVAASLFGGVVIVDLLRERIYRIEPKFLIYVTIIIPKEVVKIDKKTGFARSILPKTLDLGTHVKQSSMVAKLVYALMSSDIDLFGEAISVDFVAEPHRAKLIPYYHELKELALSLGALGFNISGAGPSVFLVHRSREEAFDIGKKLISFLNDRGLYSELIVTKISLRGAEVIG